MQLNTENNALLASVGVASCGILGYFILRTIYSERAIGTTNRPDLKGPPPTVPFLGNAAYMADHTDRLLELFVKWREQYGLGCTFTLPFMRVIDVSRPEWIEYIQKTNFNNYVKGEHSAVILKDLVGTGIFATDGERWLIQRKTTSHIFTSNSFRGIITNSIVEHLNIFVDFLQKTADSHEAVPLDELFFRMTLDTFVKMAFGRDINSLKDGKSVPFATAFDSAQTRLNDRFFFWHWRLSELFSSEGRKMRRNVKTVDEFAYEIIDQRAKESENGKESTDLLSLYLKMKDEDGNLLSREEIRHAVINLVIAGRDTTAQALSWAFFHLIKEPELYQKVRDEVKDVEVNFDNYKKLTYTNAVFHESLRLHPPVPKNLKQAVNDDQIPNGPTIKKGDFVRYSDWQMARDPTIWGPDCREFKPERFIDEKGNLIRFDNYKFHTFNAGPRLCLGVNLATYEATSTLAALVKNFDMKFQPGWYENVEKVSGFGYEEDTPLYGNSLTHPMKHRMMVIVSPASS